MLLLISVLKGLSRLVARPFPFVPFLSIGFFFSHSSPFPITFLFSRLFRLIQISAEQPDLWTRGDLVARTFIACVKRLTRL
ncbi:hypothetical protein RCL_jg9778.t1 [Rhizophagus clarus]|uniref:Uncharacterized protein n=1 Tax=Rhizophagus clarus TaxID=94130 RepID=A0A8H3LYN9_9GLOM|nr:hypothetical protein RCL_jg9778.t1 [Rhizophagus clarus]